jgi:hypothetical protein
MTRTYDLILHIVSRQHSPDSIYQFPGCEGLGEVNISANSPVFDLIGIPTVDDRRNRESFTQPPAGSEPA